jgi:hypothetical protein
VNELKRVSPTLGGDLMGNFLHSPLDTGFAQAGLGN